MVLEHERTFLAKRIPPEAKRSPSKEIIDIFLPTQERHPTLRLRRYGDTYEITKKYPAGDDHRIMHEHNTPLSKEEFEELAHAVKGKRARKTRYYYDFEGKTWEFNVYHDDLQGLVVVEVEFADEKSMREFELPDFILEDVSQEEFLAGGYLAGRTYAEIEPMLKRHRYSKLQG